MQWLADLLVALFTESVEFLSEWWPSLVLFAVLVPLLRGRKLRVAAPPPWVMYAAIGALAFGVAVVRTVVVGEPHPPWFNDNFGYLLEADTFLHGRLANPVHPMHRYFDTLYVIQTPSYASEYPPGIPLLLAGARLVFRLPVVGLWIGCAAAAVAIAWAAGAVASREVAWVGGILAALHPLLMQSSSVYHPASVPALGGALAVGGALRLPRAAGEGRLRRLAAIAMGIGMAILANTRPYEGLVVAIAVCAFALITPRALAIAVATTLALMTFTFVQNRAVTGSALTFPYPFYSARYLSAPNFIWQKPYPPKSYPTRAMADTYSFYRHYYERSRNLGDFMISARERLKQMLADSVPSGVSRPSWTDSLRLFAGLPFLFGLRQKKIAAALGLFILAILQVTWWPQPHYLAPAAGLVAVLYCAGMQRLIDRGHSALAYASAFVAIFSAIVADRALLDFVPPSDSSRMYVTELLEPRGVPALIVADDRCNHTVFNSAEIDAQQIVWAHTVGDGDGALLDYYRDRDVWRLACTPFRFDHVRAPLEPPRRAAYTRDLFSPSTFRGRLRQFRP